MSSTTYSSTATDICGSVIPIVTTCPGYNKFSLLVKSGLDIKNSSTLILLLNTTSSIVSPSFTVYVFWASVVPNKRYFDSSDSSKYIVSATDIFVCFTVIFSSTYISSIILPVVVICACVFCKYFS